jgi:hypothetical protein
MDHDKPPNEKKARGSWPRCQHFVRATREDVANNLTLLVGLPGVVVSPGDAWMPSETTSAECKLVDASPFLSDDQKAEVGKWWLTHSAGANTPNWDIASTCRIQGNHGLILIEAKAHAAELHDDGKAVGKSGRSEENHERIGAAIKEASDALRKTDAGFNLSANSHYQLANRFAWSWKLAAIGVPVVLIYLGFLRANEMHDIGEPFVDEADWARVVFKHSEGIVPDHVWGRPISLSTSGAATFTPLIRSAFVAHSK